MSQSHENPPPGAGRRGATPFEVWVRRSLHARFDMVCAESMPMEILTQFEMTSEALCPSARSPPCKPRGMDS
ncbi:MULTISPECIES: hypothetical protein [Komagataeibacter]|uniref:Uncharacterized protein n=1 Tax=Komagataeibacter saccharivorans TaxID=265959 RepID=A0A347WAY4_9PROT|nr:hypothetical protein [Komagataeibacter saccharivorans]AXY22027.1 hypothetical protein CD178_01243 [Komagataeibacter saccharivorans]PYD49720.1 hypothetical protein CFR79_13095 [Komagataeibacter saccharivorans]QBL94043.1 hypothetical protein KSAC_18260 [Komagataeibacter saccharivorans]